MHRIDGNDTSPTLPTPEVAGVSGYFKSSSGIGDNATQVTRDWANSTQEEIANVVLSAGIELDKTANNQMAEAIDGYVTTLSSDISILTTEVSGQFTHDKMVHVQYIAGGTGTGLGGSGTWSTCPINTTLVNTVGATIASSQISNLPVGTYQVLGTVTVASNSASRAKVHSRLRDTNSSVDLVNGSNSTDDNLEGPGATMDISGQMEIDGTEIIEVQGWWLNVINTVNMYFGINVSSGSNALMMDLRLWKVS